MGEIYSCTFLLIRSESLRVALIAIIVLLLISCSQGNDDTTQESNKNIDQEEKIVREQEAESQRRLAQLREEAQTEIQEEINFLQNIVGHKILKICSGTIYPMQRLLSMKPSEADGKCFFMETFPAKSIKVFNRTTALLAYRDQVIFADFAAKSAPLFRQLRTYVVKGEAKPYEYKSDAREKVRVVKVKVLKEITDED